MPKQPLSSVGISASALACIRAAAIAAYPNEACGLLFGTEARIIEATDAKNIAAEPASRFEIDPAALFAAHRRSREGPLALIGCWHSHPNGAFSPSTYDAAGVADPAWIWLIEAHGTVSAHLPHSASSTGFRPVNLAEDGPAAMV